MSSTVRLPAPPDKYDRADQAELRRVISDGFLQVPDQVAGEVIAPIVVLSTNQVVPGLGIANVTVVNEIGTVAIGPNETWVFDWDIFFNAETAAGGAAFLVRGPAGSAGTVRIDGNTSGITVWVTNFVALGTLTTSVWGAGVTVELHVLIRAVVRNGANAGNVTLEFDPQGSVNFTIRADSHRLVARKVT